MVRKIVVKKCVVQFFILPHTPAESAKNPMEQAGKKVFIKVLLIIIKIFSVMEHVTCGALD